MNPYAGNLLPGQLQFAPIDPVGKVRRIMKLGDDTITLWYDPLDKDNVPKRYIAGGEYEDDDDDEYEYEDEKDISIRESDYPLARQYDYPNSPELAALIIARKEEKALKLAIKIQKAKQRKENRKWHKDSWGDIMHWKKDIRRFIKSVIALLPPEQP